MVVDGGSEGVGQTWQGTRDAMAIWHQACSPLLFYYNHQDFSRVVHVQRQKSLSSHCKFRACRNMSAQYGGLLAKEPSLSYSNLKKLQRLLLSGDYTLMKA